MEKIDLLKYVETGGCSAKIPAKDLESVLINITKVFDPNILVDIDNHDDAGVYKINDELALIFTTDFFPPVCSDPYEFGQIAATNSMSDVYAMGGEVMLALNISMFPKDDLPLEAYAQILAGGNERVVQCGGVIMGGHTINDATPKYGLAVVGRVRPQELVTNSGLRVGDKLILTKPIGTGIVIAAHKLGLATETNYLEIIASMKTLNRGGATVMRKFGAKGGTDITGFGLLGHTLKMALASDKTIVLNMKNIPQFTNVINYVSDGCVPCAAFKNFEYVEDKVTFDASVEFDEKMILCDAQTSGGLLFGIDSQYAQDALAELIELGYTNSAIIGEVVDGYGTVRIQA